MKSFNLSDSEKIKLNEIKTKKIFKNIKSKYIIKIIFDNLSKKRTLDIIKYNQKIQNKINININDYKEYSELYSSIEIEIIPVNNKFRNFINIDKEDEIYYHIYFNNNKKEIKRNYLKKNEQINSIKIIITYQVKLFENLFDSCICIGSIYFKKFSRNNIQNMCAMFYKCLSLKELNITKFNTNNVTDMSLMFF